MKIYVSHSSDFDFQNELYVPLKQSILNAEHEIILPHEQGEGFISKDVIKACDIFVAEVSYPSTGSGIEIGWADMLKKPIICVYKEGNKISNSLKRVTDIFIPYETRKDFAEKLAEYLKKSDL